MAARNPNVGRRFMNAPTSTVHKPVGSGDSGGKIFNPVQKPKSNVVNANVPVAGPSAGRMQEGYPGMNVAAVNTPVNAPGGGKVTKKVAGVAKFYGR